MRDVSRPIKPPLPENYGDRISSALKSQREYDKHVAPIVQWALAEAYGSRRVAHDALVRLRNDEQTSDIAFALLGQAVTALTR